MTAQPAPGHRDLLLPDIRDRQSYQQVEGGLHGRRGSMAAAVFHGVQTDHAPHMSAGALYVQPSMPPSPPWKVTGAVLSARRRVPLFHDRSSVIPRSSGHRLGVRATCCL